jgi:hypothetical protein
MKRGSAMHETDNEKTLCEPQAERRTVAIMAGDIKSRWHDVGERFDSAYLVGTAERGYNSGWTIQVRHPAHWLSKNRREITPPKRRFWYEFGDYVLVSPTLAKTPHGDVYRCGPDGVDMIGTARAGHPDDVFDIVVPLVDPEQYRVVQLRRADQRRPLHIGVVYGTPIRGPLAGLAVGQRFAFSWGDSATIERIGQRKIFFRVDRCSETAPVDRQLTSEETQAVTAP